MFGGSGWSTYAWGGWILNASDSPIYDTVVTFYLATDDAARTWTSQLIKVVPPYRGEQFVYVGDEARDKLTDDQWKNQIEVSLDFRDAAGRCWLRDRQGYLHERPGPPRAPR